MSATDMDRALATQQTIADKNAVWQEFFSRLRPGSQRILANLANFTTVASDLEKKGQTWTVQSVLQAVRDNVDYLEWDRSAEVAARQQAEAQASVQQSAEINSWLSEAQSFYRLAADDHNLALLTAFLLKEHKGVFSKLAADHFLRTYVGTDELHYLAEPTRPDPPTQRMYNPEHERQARIEQRKQQKDRFDANINKAKARAEFESETSRIRQYRVMAPRGINWAASFSEMKDRLSQLKVRFPQYENELDTMIAKVG